MEALFLLVPLSVCLVALAIWVFFGASDSGQFDDLEGPGLRILRDDDSAPQDEPVPTLHGLGGRPAGAARCAPGLRILRDDDRAPQDEP